MRCSEPAGTGAARTAEDAAGSGAPAGVETSAGVRGERARSRRAAHAAQPAWGKSRWAREVGSPRCWGAGRWWWIPHCLLQAFVGCRRWRGTERTAPKARRHRGSARTVPVPSARSQLPSRSAASPTRWSQPMLRLRAPQEGSSPGDAGPSPEKGTVLDALRSPSWRRRPLGTSRRKGRQEGRRPLPVAPRNGGPNTSEGAGPSARPGTSTAASRQEGIFSKRYRIIRWFVGCFGQLCRRKATDISRSPGSLRRGP